MTSEHRTCVITGASRGIGRAIAEGLGEHGANVVDYRNSEGAAHQVVDEIADGRGAAIPLRSVASEDASYMTGQILAVNGGMEW